MTAKRLLVVCLVVISFSFIICSTTIYANSLWNDSESMYSDNKAHQTGDILTVIITENSTAQQAATTDSSQENNVEVGAGSGILDFIKSFSLNQSDSSNADGSTTRSGNLSAKMAVQIVEVLDNGNFKISGIKEININSEKQKIKLTGIVRSDDITANNTIESNYIANADINYVGKGVVGDKQKPGIISRVLDLFF